MISMANWLAQPNIRQNRLFKQVLVFAFVCAVSAAIMGLVKLSIHKSSNQTLFASLGSIKLKQLVIDTIYMRIIAFNAAEASCLNLKLDWISFWRVNRITTISYWEAYETAY